MTSYSEADASYARSIVEGFLDPERGAVELEGALVVSDVEVDATEFAAELDFLEDIGADVPAVRLGDEELVPIALPFVAGAATGHPPMFSRWWRRHPLFFELADFYVRSLYEDERPFRGLETMPREQARSTFLRRATDFLAIRIAAVREFESGESYRWPTASYLNLPQRARGSQVSTPGCNFIVSANSNGLRVFWSGAYRIAGNYFSHPTSPASAVLQSGTYVFGVDGGAYGNHVQWDLNAVVTLPGASSAHLNY